MKKESKDEQELNLLRKKIIFVSSSKISDILKCQICFLVIMKGTTLSCGHFGCITCLKRIPYSKCPLCRRNYNKKTLAEDPNIQQVLRRKRIYCINKLRGCKETCLWEDLGDHLQKCQFNTELPEMIQKMIDNKQEEMMEKAMMMDEEEADQFHKKQKFENFYYMLYQKNPEQQTRIMNRQKQVLRLTPKLAKLEKLKRNSFSKKCDEIDKMFESDLELDRHSKDWLSAVRTDSRETSDTDARLYRLIQKIPDSLKFKRTTEGNKIRYVCEYKDDRLNSHITVKIKGELNPALHLGERQLKKVKGWKIEHLVLDVTIDKSNVYKEIYTNQEDRNKMIELNGFHSMNCSLCHSFVEKKQFCWVKIGMIKKDIVIDCSRLSHAMKYLCSNKKGRSLPIIKERVIKKLKILEEKSKKVPSDIFTKNYSPRKLWKKNRHVTSLEMEHFREIYISNLILEKYRIDRNPKSKGGVPPIGKAPSVSQVPSSSRNGIDSFWGLLKNIGHSCNFIFNKKGKF